MKHLGYRLRPTLARGRTVGVNEEWGNRLQAVAYRGKPKDSTNTSSLNLLTTECWLLNTVEMGTQERESPEAFLKRAGQPPCVPSIAPQHSLSKHTLAKFRRRSGEIDHLD